MLLMVRHDSVGAVVGVFDIDIVSCFVPWVRNIQGYTARGRQSRVVCHCSRMGEGLGFGQDRMVISRIIAL